MIHDYICIALAALLTCTACSKNDRIDEEEATDDQEVTFIYAKGTFANMPLSYRKATIAASNSQSPAVVVYLHGGSSKGTDNETPVREKGVSQIADYLRTRHIPAVLIVPQCPADKSWGSSMCSVLKALIDECVVKDHADSQRIYLLGGSMGGTGTWEMANSYPTLFAAAMPVAGNPSRCNAQRMAETPVLTVMGTSDKIMSAEVTASFIALMQQAGGQCRMDTEEGWSHEVTCTESYTPDRLAWLFAHTREP